MQWSGRDNPGRYELVNSDGKILPIQNTRSSDGMQLPPIEHGKRKGYLRGCKCDDCSHANNEYMNDYRSRKQT